MKFIDVNYYLCLHGLSDLFELNRRRYDKNNYRKYFVCE